MNEKEKELVVVSDQTYNLCEGGHGGFGYINRMSSKEEKIKHGKLGQEQLKKNGTHAKISPENRKKMIEGLRNRTEPPKRNKLSEEHKKRIGITNSLKQSGNLNSQFGTCWITDGNKNRKIKKEDLDKWIFLGYKRGRA